MMEIKHGENMWMNFGKVSQVLSIVKTDLEPRLVLTTLHSASKVRCSVVAISS